MVTYYSFKMGFCIAHNLLLTINHAYQASLQSILNFGNTTRKTFCHRTSKQPIILCFAYMPPSPNFVLRMWKFKLTSVYVWSYALSLLLSGQIFVRRLCTQMASRQCVFAHAFLMQTSFQDLSHRTDSCTFQQQLPPVSAGVQLK